MGLNKLIDIQGIVLNNFHQSFVIEHKQIRSIADELKRVQESFQYLSNSTLTYIQRLDYTAKHFTCCA